MNIYVANLPFSVDELQVEQLFRKNRGKDHDHQRQGNREE